MAGGGEEHGGTSTAAAGEARAATPTNNASLKERGEGPLDLPVGGVSRLHLRALLRPDSSPDGVVTTGKEEVGAGFGVNGGEVGVAAGFGSE
jgi:hypothetical protein